MKTTSTAIQSTDAPKKGKHAMKKHSTFAALCAFAIVTLAAFATIAVMHHEEKTVDPLYNSGGDHVFASLSVTDNGGSGILQLPLDGGIFVPFPQSSAIADGGMAAGDTDGSGCITASATTGLFTVAKVCGSGELELTACLNSVNSGNTAGIMRGSWQRIRAGATTQLVPETRKTEVVDAAATGPAGCVVSFDSANNGDTYSFSTASNGATAVTTTIKEASLTVVKLRQ